MSWAWQRPIAQTNTIAANAETLFNIKHFRSFGKGHWPVIGCSFRSHRASDWPLRAVCRDFPVSFRPTTIIDLLHDSITPRDLVKLFPNSTRWKVARHRPVILPQTTDLPLRRDLDGKPWDVVKTLSLPGFRIPVLSIA